MRLTSELRENLMPAEHCHFDNCHASTVIALPDNQLLAAWFAGHKEGSGDTAIWLSRRRQDLWSVPQRVVAQDNLAHWNPVLHRHDGRIWLFYKVGTDVHQWTTRVVTSDDDGASWSSPQPLVEGDRRPRGPVKNKLLVMSNGQWLAPSSVEDDRYWDAFVDITDDGKQWQSVAIPLIHQAPADSTQDQLWQGLQQDALWENDLSRVFQWDGVIQPTAWESSPGQIHLLMRSTRGRIYRSDSMDFGQHWTTAYPIELPNNNSGIDVVHLGEGKLVLAYNPIPGNWNRRYPLSVAYSTDNGLTWEKHSDLESDTGEFSYPAIIAERENIHITYTWNRKNIIYQRMSFLP
ncbi:sialidase family protein [Brenneria tiliae]|uniref:Exo-alpha-sialidase n=1 Tax=Brenneria tiliae TaxID=2914984 RepID=A0ABT0MZH3_9GAMM|nr:exo-alpha-sialidase [Brenneria tiliae]MCL2895255.1 exo-alpha-sialidase [Brenneria tiliae]